MVLGEHPHVLFAAGLVELPGLAVRPNASMASLPQPDRWLCGHGGPSLQNDQGRFGHWSALPLGFGETAPGGSGPDYGPAVAVEFAEGQVTSQPASIIRKISSTVAFGSAAARASE